jgi:hypothetical protein
MSSPRSLPLLVTAAVLVLTGCGRSPATRAPVKVVRVDSRAAVLCNCDDDDEDDDDELVPPKAKPVEYVKMTEWQPPPSAQRVEAEIAPRGEEPPSYIQFPRLELHKPIDQPGHRPMGLYFRRKR